MRAPRRAVPVIAAASIASLLLTGSVSPSPTRLEAARQSIAAESSPRVVTIEVSLVAAIVESPTTIGVAESTLYNLSAQDLDKQLQVLKDAGVTDLRIAVPWVYIQPTSSTEYDWTKMDAVIDKLHAEGFSITASITGNPAWDGVPLAGAPNPSAYASFAGETAARYAGKISAYEVWNEPNGALFYAPVNPEGYTEVLKAAYTAIKASDPDALVVGGVLGAVRTVPGVTLNPVDFLDRMYKAGAEGYFDAISYHPYHYTSPFSLGLGEADSPLEQALALRALMIANGDEDLKLWATEYGVPTTPFFGLSQSQQAAFMADFISAWQEFEGAGPAFLYSGHDLGTGEWDSEANFGLFTSNWTPKLAVAVISAMIADMEDGVLDNPQYAQRIPDAQALFIQVASTVLGLVNTALIVPRAIGQALHDLAVQVVEAVRSVFSPPAAASAKTTSVSLTDDAGSPESSDASTGVTDLSEDAAGTPQRDVLAQRGVSSTVSGVTEPNIEVSPDNTTPLTEETAVSALEEKAPEEKAADESSSDDPAPVAEGLSGDTDESPAPAAEADDTTDTGGAEESPASAEPVSDKDAKKSERQAKKDAKKAEREAKKAEREAAKTASDASAKDSESSSDSSDAGSGSASE